MKKKRKHAVRGASLVIVLAAVLAVAICGWLWRNYSIKVETAAAVAALDGKRRQWDDVLALALKTSRIALAGPVGQMQTLQREVEQINVPPCLEPAKEHLENSMGEMTHAFLAFMGKDEAESAAMMESASREMAAYKDAAKRCGAAKE